MIGFVGWGAAVTKDIHVDVGSLCTVSVAKHVTFLENDEDKLRW